jgi:quercetin dioxygenase-like cupin family protein
LTGSTLGPPGALAGDEPSKEPAPLTKPKLVGDDEGETVWVWAGVRMTVKVRGADTGGAYSVFEDWLPPGAGPPLHTHTREHESMYVLEGGVRATLGDQTFDLKTGSLLHMPLGVPHSFKNLSDKPARLLLSYAPGGFEKLFLEFGKPAKWGDTTPAKFTEEEVKNALAASERYGVFRVKK